LFKPMPTSKLKVRKEFDSRIAVLKLFPGITPSVVQATVRIPDLQGLIIETFGSGNAPTEAWFIDALEEAINRGVIVLNVTQCKAGAVQMRQYQASCDMDRIGVIGGNDITIEAAVTKMMYLLGIFPNEKDKVRDRLSQCLRGEISIEINEEEEEL
ncbi:MAG: L-asparaginase 1, partial [Bacteroidales bacterium]|nr:L-asparaginase 1 [Bacteroidales bacterium]